MNSSCSDTAPVYCTLSFVPSLHPMILNLLVKIRGLTPQTSRITLGNSTSVAYTHDLLNRLTALNNSLNSGSKNFSYGYNDAGMRISETGPRGAVAFDYNNRYEVTGVTEPSGSSFADQEFTYDDAYNRLTWKLGSATTNYVVNNLNQYTTVSSHTAPTWNNNGNLATFNGKTYSYDTFNRLTLVAMSTGSVEFSYDPMGRRVMKVVKNSGGNIIATHHYHHDGNDIAVEYRPSSVTWTYFLGPEIDDIVMRTDGTNKQYYYKNGLGSVIAVANSTGDLTEGYEYNVQGQVAIFNSAGSSIGTTGIGNDHLYTGRQLDPETGDYYYRARYYSPILGRFISRDPLSGAEFSQGSNLYAYVANNGVNYFDPWGLDEISVHVHPRSGITEPGHVSITKTDGAGNSQTKGFWPGGVRDDSSFVKDKALKLVDKTFDITEEQRKAAEKAIDDYKKEKWSIDKNCTDTGKSALDAAGQKTPDFKGKELGKEFTDPNKVIDWIKSLPAKP